MQNAELDELVSADMQVTEKNPEVDKEIIRPLITAIDTKYAAFRKKVTACCEVCRSLDEACQVSRDALK